MTVAMPHKPIESFGEKVAPIVLPFPLQRTHCGFALGNGMFGALIWGERTLNITINRSDFWDHRAGQELLGDQVYDRIKASFDPDDARSADAPFEAVTQPWAGGAFRNTRLPMGRFEIGLAPGLMLADGALDVERGELTIRLLGATAADVRRVVIALHPRHCAMMIHDPSRALADAQMRPAWEWVGPEMRSRGFVEPSIVDADGDRGWSQACPADQAMAAVCRRTGDHLLIAMMPGDHAHVAVSAARRTIDDVFAIGWARFRDEVHDWWRAYWRDLPRVELPDPFFNDFLRLAMYKFGAATNPHSGTPCALQGPWCEEYQMPPWSCDYHFNVNVQQIYTLAFAAGKAAHLLPLFDMLDRCRPLFRRNARRMVGIDDGLLITHTTDDRGYACGGVGPGASIDHAVSGWTAQLYWLYYRHTGDLVFLRDRAMPFMTGVMRTYEAMLEWNDGVPTLPVSISAEYGHPLPDGTRQRVGRDPSSQFACMHMLLRALIQGAEALGHDIRPQWLRLREALPQWTLVGRRGDEHIGIWKDTDLTISHRHHSHLSCIYPFDSLGDRTPEMQAIVRRSLERWLEVGMSDWSEWCLPWAAILQAREGYREGPYLLLKLLRDIFINEGLATVYIPRIAGFTLHGMRWRTGPLEACEIMQLDGTMAAATALHEMLVHAHAGEIRFFPAVPEAWKDVAFRNIRLPGPVLASAEQVGGEVRRIRLSSKATVGLRIVVPGYRSIRLHRCKVTKEVALPCDVRLGPDESIEAVPIR